MTPFAEGLLRLPFAWTAALGIAAACVGASHVIDPEVAWTRLRPLWGRTVLKLAGVDVHVAGAERLVGPAIFVSNHPGYMDAVLSPALMPPQTKWLMKREFGRVPILGRACAGGAFFIDRGDSAQARRAIEDGVANMPAGWSLLVYPEGTRQRDDYLGPFKKGVFHLALMTRLPLVPLASYGGNAVMPAGGLVVRPGRIDVAVGEPIMTASWRQDEVDARMAEIRAAVQACVDASRGSWRGGYAG